MSGLSYHIIIIIHIIERQGEDDETVYAALSNTTFHIVTYLTAIIPDNTITCD